MDEIIAITPETGKRMLAGALWNLDKHCEEINEQNEFPVPDKDTGTNVYITIGEATSEIWTREYAADFSAFCNDLEEELLISISGNAGTISAAFLSGFFEGLAPYAGEPLGRHELYQGFWKAKERAIKSVYDPKEGTMLDVIKAAEDGIRMCGSKDIREGFGAALKAAREDLPHTKDRNPVQKKAGKVDAGALGFVFVLEGLRKGLFNEEEVGLPERIERMDFDREISDISENTNLENPYEVQFILEPAGGIQEVHEFRSELGKLGDSLDIFTSASGASLRIHIHSKEVEAIQRLAEKCGDTSHVRVIDMRDEIKAQYGQKRKIMIVTDAGADLPWSVLAQGVLVVPFRLNFPERSKLSGTFYERMLKAKDWPTTSQPSHAVFTKQIQNALHLAEEVVVITISSGTEKSRISGSYESALKAADNLSEKSRSRVVVLDSRQAACGQALMVHKALELAREGKGALEILAHLNELKGRIKLFGYPRDISYLIRGGRGGLRAGSMKAKFALLLQKIGFHPLLCLSDGKIKSAGIRCGSDFAGMLYDCIRGNLPGIDFSKLRFAISYAGNEERSAGYLRDYITIIGIDEPSLLRVLKQHEVFFAEQLNRVIGVHTGPALLVAWYEE